MAQITNKNLGNFFYQSLPQRAFKNCPIWSHWLLLLTFESYSISCWRDAGEQEDRIEEAESNQELIERAA